MPLHMFSISLKTAAICESLIELFIAWRMFFLLHIPLPIPFLIHPTRLSLTSRSPLPSPLPKRFPWLSLFPLPLYPLIPREDKNRSTSFLHGLQVTPEVETEGWEYATTFFNSRYQASESKTDMVRRRRWHRRMVARSPRASVNFSLLQSVSFL